jgi:tRNA-specific 2-thiouridylase
MMNNKALIAMSGGVDSSVAAALVKEQGYDCAGITLKLDGSAGDDANVYDAASMADAASAAKRLMFPHQVFDFREFFREKVIKHFIESYEQGLTPNPCIECNRNIKFGLLLAKALSMNFDYLVTGHYARIEKGASGRSLLKKSFDKKKDQSYVLYTLNQEQLRHIIFPLGELAKEDVRKIAGEYGLANALKKESQDICFIPDGDYGAFMEQRTGKHYPEGDIIDAGGKILGRHRGIVRYTLGQRRGLGVAANIPVYVTAKNMTANTITLGNEGSLYTKTVIAKNINLIACDNIIKPARVMAKTRYLQEEKPALAEQTGPDEALIEFDEGQRAVTPGQAVVFYDGDTVIGGGTIVSSC